MGFLLAIVSLAACGGGGTSTGNDSAGDTNSPAPAPDNPGPVGGTPGSFGAPVRNYDEVMECAVGSAEGTRQQSSVRYSAAGSVLSIEVPGQQPIQISPIGSWDRQFHESSTTHETDVSATNYRRIWMTIDDDGRLIGSGVNGKVESDTVYCGVALRDPAPTPTPSPTPVPTPAPDLSAPSSYDVTLNCALGDAAGPTIQSRFTYDKPTQFMTITRGSISRQASAMGTWSKQNHAASSTYAVDANGALVRRFWMVVGTNGQLLGGGMNGISNAESLYCGVSARNG